MSPSDAVRTCFAAYETKNRHTIDSLLTDDFTFSSPLDDNISRQRYFERCWPNSEHLARFDILETVETGNKVFVRYRAHPTSGPAFENTEVFTFAPDGNIRHVDVYFGRESAPRSDTPSDEQQIRTLLDARADAIRNKHAAALPPLSAPGSVNFFLAPPLVAAEPLIENAEKWFATWRGPIGYQTQHLKIAVGSGVAYAHCLNRMTGAKLDGEQIDLWFRLTIGFRKIDGHWRIAHEHESVPFKMDGTLQAAVDLKP